VKYDCTDGRFTAFSAGDALLVQRGAVRAGATPKSEDDGYLVSFVTDPHESHRRSRCSTRRGRISVTGRWRAIPLPRRVPHGFHGDLGQREAARERTIIFLVVPAKAGTHVDTSMVRTSAHPVGVEMDPRFRGDDRAV
jgi:hypothetical protein